MGCNKSFKAVEVVMNDGYEKDEEEDETLGNFMLKRKNIKKKKMN